MLEWEALGLRDRLAILRMTTPLKLARQALRPDARTIAASPGETVEAWLIRNGQTARLREMLWNPLALAALNQPPDHAAAPVFARVLGEMFGADASAAAIGLPTRPLHLMYAEPAREYIERHGGAVRTGATAKVVIAGTRAAAVEAEGERWTPAAVIAAVPWFALADLFDGEVGALGGTVSRASHMTSCPVVTVNLWLDRPALDEPLLGLPGRDMQWVFDKRAAFGGDASYLALVSSGASLAMSRTNPELIATAHHELMEALPQVREARLLRATVVREPRATFSLAPGQPARPPADTPVEGLHHAGDWIDTGLPATIESAVRSGHKAADRALAG